MFAFIREHEQVTARILYAGRSDPGNRRPNNEDAYLVRPELRFAVLADGMGGAAAGEIAGNIFVETILEVFLDSARFPAEKVHEFMQNAFHLANERILADARAHPQRQGMGCTAEVIAFHDQGYVVGHVGDSRTYLFRRGRLRQLTVDHSLVQQQVEQGLITPDQARKHPLRHVILRAVGTSRTLALDLLKGEVYPADIFLLCSDGLTDMIEDASIASVLSSDLTLQEKVDSLVDMAKSAGGFDNITVILNEVISV